MSVIIQEHPIPSLKEPLFLRAGRHAGVCFPVFWCSFRFFDVFGLLSCNIGLALGVVL